MEDEKNSANDLSERTSDQKNGTERRSLAESKMFIIETLEEEERSSTKGSNSNSFRKEAMKENNGILKETTASFSKTVSDTGTRDESARERKEDAVTKIIIADEFNETLPQEFPSDGSKREIKNPREIGDMAITDKHRCQHHFRDIIGKREQRREELDKMEGDLRQRLDMLECSIPAVMIWNIWRMSQGAPVCRIKRILEKQFKDTRELSCRSTPSCHYDCRIREVEAERKLALKKVEEARTLWSEKLATLEERKRKLDEAKRIQEEQKSTMERLNEETRVMRETMEKRAMEMDELCKCDDAQCKQKHLSKVSSMMSVESGDIQWLEKLQRLAEEEVITKREIAELERREEAYMRTLQQADELWSKMEGDRISTTNELQEQLDIKTTANQQLANRVCELEDALEKCQARLVACRTELEKFLSIEKVEAMIGRDDDIAKVADKEVAVRAKVVHRPVGRVDDVATVKDDEVLAKIEIADEEALARVEVEDREALARVILIDADTEAVPVRIDKDISVKPDLVDLAVDRPVDLVRIEDAESVVRPEDIAYEQQKFEEVREYLSKLDSLEELYKDDGETCAPDFVCNDVVSSPIGMTDEEMVTLDVKYTVPTKELDISDEKREEQLRKELARNAHDIVDIEEEKEDEIPGVEIEREVVEKMEERVAETVPVRETITPRKIEEEAADDRLVTMPKDRAPEINKFEADRSIVIQRDTILSWIDAIDTIRTTAARHPDCHEVKKDADILAEQVGTYVGIKPKEVKEEIATIIVEDKQKKVIEKNEIKTEQNENEIKTEQNKNEIKTEQNKNEIKTEQNENKINVQDKLIILKAEEIEPVIKLESVPLPNSDEETAVEIKAPIEAIAESVLLPTLTKEEVSIDMEPPTAVSIEDSSRAPTIHNKEDPKDDTVPELYKPNTEKINTEETRVKDNAQDTTIEISKNENAERNAIKDLTNNKLPVVTNDKMVNFTDEEETLIVPKIEKEEQEITSNRIERNEEKDIPTEIKKEEMMVENEETDKVLPETEIKEEIEKVEQEKTTLAMDVTEVKEIIPETNSPTVDIIEEEKFDKFPTVESPLITNTAKTEQIEITELPPMADTIKKEKVEAEELLSLADAEKIEIIQPVSPAIKKEIEGEIEGEAEESVFKIEIEKEKDKEIEKEITLSEEVTLPIKLPEEKEEEIPSVEKKKILPEVPSFKKLTPKDKKEVPVDEKKPEVAQIELKIPIGEIKLTEMKIPAIPLDPQLVAQPYLIIAKFKEKELIQIMSAKQPCTECCLQSLIETARPFDVPQTKALQTGIVQTEVIQAEVVQTETVQTKIVQNEVVQTEIVQTEAAETEVVQITTQTVTIAEPPRKPPIRIISEYLKPVELKASRTDIVGDRPEITGRKMLWRKRLKDQSTVTTASTGSQTDKTSHVSHDRVVRDERERARVPTDELLRSIKIAAGLVRPDTEREIRTINYGRRSEEMGKATCNCCLCGRIPTPPTEPRLEIQPQIDAKTATPPAVAAFKRMFIRPKIDHPTPYDRLCPDCKAKIQSRMPRERHHVEKIIKKISRDQESCGCTSLTSKSCRAVLRKKPIEKKDQACLAKIPKRKTNPEAKKKGDMQSILEKKLTVEPLSPSCICFKLEKTSVEPIKKGNCYCAD